MAVDVKIETNMIPCIICGLKVKNFQELCKHSESYHSSDGKFQCAACPQTYSAHSRFLRHLFRHLIRKSVQCDHCGRGFCHEFDLKEHVRKSHNHRFHCLQCSFSTNFHNKLIRHEETHKRPPAGNKRPDNDLEKQHKCSFCPATFTTKRNLTKHVESKHSLYPENDKFSPESEILFPVEFSFTEVPDCYNIYMVADCSALRSEVQKTQNQDDDEKIFYKCTKCDYKNTCKRNLTRHMASHSDKRPFKCMLCDLSRKEERHLRIHANKKHPEVPFLIKKCVDITDAEFQCQFGQGDFNFYEFLDCPNSKPSLTKISQESDYAQVNGRETFKDKVCEICGYKTTSRQVLEEHLTTHSEERNVICKICGARYKAIRGLNSHYKSKHPDKLSDIYKRKKTDSLEPGDKVMVEEPFICTVCGKSVKFKKSLKYHLKRFHQDHENLSQILATLDWKQEGKSPPKQHHNVDSEVPDSFSSKIEPKFEVEETEDVDDPSEAAFDIFDSLEYLKTNDDSSSEIDEKFNLNASDIKCDINIKNEIESLTYEDNNTIKEEVEQMVETNEFKLKSVVSEDIFGNSCDEQDEISENIDENPIHSDQSPNEPAKSKPTRSTLCKVCGFQAVTFKMYCQHLKTHRPDEINQAKMMQCNHCGYTATRKSKLDRHMLIHDTKDRKNKIFSCDQCDFRTHYNNLSRHIREVHQNVKSVSICDLCGKQFYNNEKLKDHKRSKHGIGQLFSCDQCFKQFSRKDNLNQHIKSVHEKQKYYCDSCNFEATNPSNILHHLKSCPNRVHE